MNQQPHSITYEQPLNESVRVCLRLEQLFAQLNENQAVETSHQAREASSALARILEVIDRPDLKSKLTQTMTQYATSLTQLKKIPQVDQKQLDGILQRLEDYCASLHGMRSRLGERINQNELLKQIRMLGNVPGGACYTKAPAYQLWLSLPVRERQEHLHHWLEELGDLRQMVELILHLLRDSTMSESVTSESGFYHQAMDPALNCELVRITVPVAERVFPEVSVGRHRLTIRLMQPEFSEGPRATQVDGDMPFKLALCRL